MLLLTFVIYVYSASQGAHKGRGPAGLQFPQTPQNRTLKSTDFVHIMISKVLRDFPFSRNQPLKSAADSTLEF